MNKIFLRWVTIISVSLIQTNNLFAQQAAKSTATGDERVDANVTAQTSNTPGKSGSSGLVIHPKAIKLFLQQYRDATDADWLRSGNFYVARFSKDNAKTRVVYDRKGNRLYSITQYGEKELPRDVRTVVKSSYFDYDIVTVREVQERDITAFFVHLEDKTTIKIVTVINGEMNTFKTLTKSL